MVSWSQEATENSLTLHLSPDYKIYYLQEEKYHNETPLYN
jgi:hypothetical protein